MTSSRSVFAACIWVLASMLPLVGNAQLAGHNTRGDFGLQSGTQAPPGFYIAPLIYDYRADTLRDRNGDSRPIFSSGGDIDIQAAVFGLLWTSEKKILGANYGLGVWPGFTNNALEAPITGVEESTSAGLADLYLQPVILGWTAPRADFTAGLGVYAPTGSWELGGAHNRGLGMWSYEVFGGTTVYFDEAKTWHFAMLAAYETHGKKDDTDIRAGDLVTLEGGIGKSFRDGTVNIGLSYYAQWKVSRDDVGSGIGFPNGPLDQKHRVFGFGPEVTLPIASTRTLFGFLTLRYLWETGARSTLEGNTLVASFTFPYPSIPLQ